MGIGAIEFAILAFILAGPVLLGIAFAIYLILRARSASDSHHQPQRQSPLDILEERYARGEIDSDEYEERRRRLLDNLN
jgi:putative membrane protein